jgi:hypothetical protein
MRTGEAGFAAAVDRHAERDGAAGGTDDPEPARLVAIESVLDRLHLPGRPSPQFRARLRARLLDEAVRERHRPGRPTPA